MVNLGNKCFRLLTFVNHQKPKNLQFITSKMSSTDTAGSGKSVAEIQTKLNATKECISVMNDVKVKLTKNKVTEAELPR